jgi:hypothetical protein
MSASRRGRVGRLCSRMLRVRKKCLQAHVCVYMSNKITNVYLCMCDVWYECMCDICLYQTDSSVYVYAYAPCVHCKQRE